MTFRLSDYVVTEQDGQLVVRFEGLWTEVTMWEVYGLALMSEMKTRAALSTIERAGAGCVVCAGQDEAVGEDRTAARGAGGEDLGVWNAAAA